MPLYEYQCDACGREFELIRKFSDPPLEKCPHCGGAVRKLFSSPAIQFKGSGFYITDYAKKDSSTASSSSESRAESKDRDASEKSGDKSGEKVEKTDKADRGDKSATTETTKPKPSGEVKPSTSAPKKDAS